MLAKLELIRELSTIASRTAIEAGLGEAQGSVRLCHADNLGIREIVPTLMVLLGQFQDAYDFIKWRMVIDWTGDWTYNWTAMSKAFRKVRDADMSEPLPASLRRGREVFYTSVLVYIKMTLASAVQDAIHAHEGGNTRTTPLPVSVGAFLAPNGRVRGVSELQQLYDKLIKQTNDAFALTHSKNQYFWNAMLNPVPIAYAPKPEIYEKGDANHVKLWVWQCAMLWRDHHAFVREDRRAFPDGVTKKPTVGLKWYFHYF